MEQNSERLLKLMDLNIHLLEEVVSFTDYKDQLVLLKILNKRIYKTAQNVFRYNYDLKIENVKLVKNIKHDDDGYGLSVFYKKYKNRNLAIAGFSDKTAIIFDIDQNCVVALFVSHTDWINTVCDLSDDEEVIKFASGSYDTTVRIWEINLENYNGEIQNVTAPKKTINFTNSIYYILRTRFSNLNRDLIAVCTFQEVVFFDSTNGNEVARSGKIHGNYVYCVVNISNFKLNHFASCSYDHKVKLSEFSEKTVTTVATLEGHTDAVWFMAYNPEYKANILVSGGWDKTAIIWDLITQSKLFQLAGNHVNSIWSMMAITHKQFNKGVFLTGGTDGKCFMCNYDGKVLKELSLHGNNALYYFDMYEDKGKFFLLVTSLEKTLGVHEIII